MAAKAPAGAAGMAVASGSRCPRVVGGNGGASQPSAGCPAIPPVTQNANSAHAHAATCRRNGRCIDVPLLTLNDRGIGAADFSNSAGTRGLSAGPHDRYTFTSLWCRASRAAFQSRAGRAKMETPEILGKLSACLPQSVLTGGCTLASKIGESWGDGVMAAHDFHLITHWRVRSSLEEVYSILINPRDYPRWWPEVFLRAQEVRHGDAVGASRTARFNVRGYLPYSLWFQAEVVEARYPFGFITEVNGDFNGRGIWTFQKAGPWVFTTFDWQVR